MAIHDGGPAFPQTESRNGNPMDAEYASAGGMSLRDYFAAQVVAYALSNDVPPAIVAQGVDAVLRGAVTIAYQVADAMLAQRAKDGKS